MGRLATDYKIVVRPWESSIRPCISYATFPRSENSYVHLTLGKVQASSTRCLYTNMKLGISNFYVCIYKHLVEFIYTICYRYNKSKGVIQVLQVNASAYMYLSHRSF